MRSVSTLQGGKPLLGNFPTHAERTFHRDLAEAEVFVIENLGYYQLLRRTIDSVLARLAILEVAIDTRDLADVVALARIAVTDLMAFVAKALLHRNPKTARIDQLNFSAT